MKEFFSILTSIQTLAIVLKIFNVLDISWWLILLPTELFLLIVIIIAIMAIVAPYPEEEDRL